MICATITIDPPPEPLQVTNLELRYEQADELVVAKVTITGAGSGTLKMTWGTQGPENIPGFTAGTWDIGNAMPPGTHQICAEMGR